MTASSWFFWLAAGFGLFLWVGAIVDALRYRWKMQFINDQPADGPDPLPRLSVIIPALNEEATVEAAMRTLLSLDYPDLELIAVDDRSTDRTGEILDRLALESSRLRVVHVTDLPHGWLGKNHALQVGGEAATGDFILFTDADVHFEPSVLQRAVRWCLAHGTDHLVVFPEVILKGFWETVTVWFFGVIFTLSFKPWRVADPKKPDFIGVGAFNLVRAETYRRMGGHAALSMDVADDIKLGKKMKQAGGRLACLMGNGAIRIRWIEGVWGIITGLTKNMYAGAEYNPGKALGGIVAVFIFGAWPAIGLFLGPFGPRLLCAATLLSMIGIAARGRPYPRANPLYALGFPLAAFVVMFIILRSMVITHRQGGVLWRGTLYPLSELRKGVV